MNNIQSAIQHILAENDRRNKAIAQPFVPATGEGAPLPCTCVRIGGYLPSPIYIPNTMMDDERVSQLVMCGDIDRYARLSRQSHDEAMEEFEALRCRHDFFYWAWRYVRIKPKDGGDDIPFTLNRPQRRLVEAFEQQRRAGRPIRVIVLKARQWGGSTVTQIYMAWLQLVHLKGLNSLIVGHVKTASAEVSSMFDKVIERYPIRLLSCSTLCEEQEPSLQPIPSATMCSEVFDLDDETASNPRASGRDKKADSKAGTKITGDRNTRLLRYIPLRNCKIKVGSAETPNSARGGDSALVHCTEVAFWRKTDNKTPEDIIRSACAGASFRPYTMIVYESTANGTGNFFQREYDAAKRGESQFEALFVAWWQIEQYALATDDITALATALWQHREESATDSDRREPGRYLWRLWQMGATLEAINWYANERRKYNDHGNMAAEFPSDDIEAFQQSGAHVFDPYHIHSLWHNCRLPRLRGDLSAQAKKGAGALASLRFDESADGQLWIWTPPETFADSRVTNRYLVVVDIGGRSTKADWSVICVIDRYWMMEGERPEICAQWYGHIDMDLLAWKAVQVAHFYDDALLVIESNTLETHDDDRWLEGGDQSSYILNAIRDVYPHLYARKQSAEDIRRRAPVKYGFHTNVKTKPEIISTLIETIREGLYVERDTRCLDEYTTYVRRQNGSYGAVDGKHDDLLMTRAIGLHICFHEMPLPRFVENAKPKHDSSYDAGIW